MGRQYLYFWICNQIRNYDLSCYNCNYNELSESLYRDLKLLLMKKNFDRELDIFDSEDILPNHFLSWNKGNDFVTQDEWEQIQSNYYKAED